MHSSLSGKKIRQHKALYLLACLILLPFALSACSPKVQELSYNTKPKKASVRVEMHGAVAPYAEKHPSGFTRKDFPHGFSEVEKNVFLTYTDIEEGITREQMFEILQFYKWYLDRPESLERYISRADPYLEYVIDALKEHNVPTEIACLAFVESGYDIDIRSRAGATGLWQFMPATGKSYGLKQDWYGDWRNDPFASTHAAIDYLKYLHSMFGDWHLAISAYNAGEGKIKRALSSTNTDTLAELVKVNHRLNRKTRIRTETLEYAPRFIAMKKIMLHAKSLGLDAPNQRDIRNEIHTALVDTNTDLLMLSQDLNMSWNEFKSHNPALKSYVSPSDRLINVHVPISKKNVFEQAIASNSLTHGVHVYKVRKNDSYKGLSRSSRVPSYVLQNINSHQRLIAGKEIVIPKSPYYKLSRAITHPSSAPVKVAQKNTSTKALASKNTSASKKVATAVNTGSHKVRKGDTLYSISRRYDVSLNDIYAANKGLKASALKIGKTIKIPNSQIKTVAMNTTHTVQSGDTLWSISRKYDMNVDTLMQVNNLPNSKLKLGQKLIVP